MDKLADRLRYAIERKGWTLDEASEKLEISRETLKGYFRGVRTPPVMRCMAMAQKLDVQGLWLYSGDGSDTESEPQTLQARLLLAIEKRGWSLKEAAEHFRISYSAILNYVNGRQRPTSGKLMLFSSILEVDPAWLRSAVPSAPRKGAESQSWNRKRLETVLAAMLADVGWEQDYAIQFVEVAFDAVDEPPIAGLDPEESAKAAAVTRARMLRKKIGGERLARKSSYDATPKNGATTRLSSNPDKQRQQL